MSYKVLTLKDNIEWNRYLRLLPINQQDIYFTPEYYSLYENYGDGEARCFVFELNGKIALYPFLINSINKLGYLFHEEYYDIQGAYGYNGVVSSNFLIDFITSFFFHFNNYCKENNIIAEFTRFHPLLRNHEFSSTNMEVLYDRNTITIDLSDTEEEIFARFQKTTKKQIRRSINRHRVQILKKEREITFLDDFLRIYWETMERVNSVRYLKFNTKYFKELFELNGTIQYYALFENKPIASITSLSGGNYMHGHLGGVLTKYLSFSTYSLLYWEMIKTAKCNGIRYLHVGGGATIEVDDRLYEFKKHFSNHITTFFIGKKIHNQAIYDNVARQWELKFPESFQKNRNKLLGYREI